MAKQSVDNLGQWSEPCRPIENPNNRSAKPSYVILVGIKSRFHQVIKVNPILSFGQPQNDLQSFRNARNIANSAPHEVPIQPLWSNNKTRLTCKLHYTARVARRQHQDS